ncbi:MAG: hypothetical protein WCK17_04055, partial [Verrucomicrobiota bacterium]
ARLQGASLVILLVGLGGGTGSGAAPCIAEAARQMGAHVAVFATLPFSFEGRRRSEQAHEGLDALRRHANLVVCFENDRMAAVADPASGIEDAFESVDSLLAQAVRAVTTMTAQKNVMHSGLDEIATTVAEHRATALFGYGVAAGEERARAALARAFSNPLFESEGALASATRLWVFVSGGSDLRWSEVQLLMQELTERISSEVRVFFGAAVDPELAGSVSVTLLAGIPDSADAGARSAVRSSRVEAIAYSNTMEPFAISETAAAASLQQVSHDREHAAEPLGTHEEHAQHVEDPALEVPLNLSEHAPEPLASSGAEFREMDHIPLEERVSAPQRSLPIPPYEAAKERRESAAQSVKRVEPTVEPVFLEPIADKSETDLAPAVAADKEADRREVAETHAEVESHTQPEVAPLSAVAKRAKDTVQEQMRFESPNRGGRFEKTDPTIVDGEDLDVPTFMRQHLPLE